MFLLETKDSGHETYTKIPVNVAAVATVVERFSISPFFKHVFRAALLQVKPWCRKTFPRPSWSTNCPFEVKCLANARPRSSRTCFRKFSMTGQGIPSTLPTPDCSPMPMLGLQGLLHFTWRSPCSPFSPEIMSGPPSSSWASTPLPSWSIRQSWRY